MKRDDELHGEVSDTRRRSGDRLRGETGGIFNLLVNLLCSHRFRCFFSLRSGDSCIEIKLFPGCALHDTLVDLPEDCFACETDYGRFDEVFLCSFPHLVSGDGQSTFSPPDISAASLLILRLSQVICDSIHKLQLPFLLHTYRGIDILERTQLQLPKNVILNFLLRHPSAGVMHHL